MARKHTHEWYDTSYVSKNVLDKGNPNKPIVLGELETQAYYAEHKIQRFESKEDFSKALRALNKNRYSNKKLDKYWEQYTQRDYLIRSGQYDDIRSNLYKENYLKNLKRMVGADTARWDKYIATLENLTPQQWLALSRDVNSDIDSPNRNRLPQIHFMYQLEGMEEDRKDAEREIEDDITRALSDIGIAVDENIESKHMKYVKRKAKRLGISEKTLINKEVLAESLPTKDLDPYRKALFNIYKHGSTKERLSITKKSREYDTFGARDKVMQMLSARERDMASRGKQMVKISKKGTAYIPFVSKEVAEYYLRKKRR